MLQIERGISTEIILELRQARPDCLVVPIPNGAVIPARMVARMIDEGQMMPGAADFVCLWRDGSGVIELKRPSGLTVLGAHRAGRPSDEQKEFAARCAAHGVRHVYAHSWDEVHGALSDWGRL